MKTPLKLAGPWRHGDGNVKQDLCFEDFMSHIMPEITSPVFFFLKKRKSLWPVSDLPRSGKLPPSPSPQSITAAFAALFRKRAPKRSLGNQFVMSQGALIPLPNQFLPMDPKNRGILYVCGHPRRLLVSRKMQCFNPLPT